MKAFIISSFCVSAFLISSCQPDVEPTLNFWDAHQPFELDYDIPFGIDATDKFTATAESRGESSLIEASGIVISMANPGFIWSHEDKNNANILFLIDQQTGETAAKYVLKGMRNRDWEDIEIGPGPEADTYYVYLAETGDNAQVYRDYLIYRFKEPVFQESHRGQTIEFDTDYDEINFSYPDRRAYDSETLLIDPKTKDLFLVTKRTFFSMIFVLPYPQKTGEPMQAILVGEFPFTRAVGGNISLDGNEMLIKTYETIMFWQRQENENMVDFFKKTPRIAPYNPTEPQGEAICFDGNNGYYTLSEFSNSVIPVLYYYERIKP